MMSEFEMKKAAQSLRRNMTKEEKYLWYDFIKKIDVPVKRQKIKGSYIVDFYIPSAKLIIEVDGEYHSRNDMPEADRIRDENLCALGYRVLRFTNEQVRFEFQAVCDAITIQVN